MIGLSPALPKQLLPSEPAAPEPSVDAAQAFARLIEIARMGVAPAEDGGASKLAEDPAPDEGDPLQAQIQALLQQLGLPVAANPSSLPGKEPGEGQSIVHGDRAAMSVPQPNPSPEGEGYEVASVADDAGTLVAPSINPTADIPMFLQPLPTALLTDETGLVPADAAALDTVQHHLDLAHDSEWLDQLAHDIARTADSGGRLRFQLNPEHLGSLHVEVAAGSQGATVRMTADSEAARSIIADAQPKLLAEARAQGMRIAEAQVDLGGQGSGSHRQGAQPAPLFVRTHQFQPETHSGTDNLQRDRYA